MIEFLQGNLLESPTQALINTVNTVGIMGKGIALQFKEIYPYNFKIYKEACKTQKIGIGKLLVVKDQDLKGEKWIINFPTKKDWRQKSEIGYIEAGLKDLVKIIQDYGFESIAVPPLGCGNGGLDWQKVKPLIEKYLGNLTLKVLVYEPNENIKVVLQKEETKNTYLTPARAILLYALFYYEILGEQVNLFVANKLAYFLQRLGEKLQIQFSRSHYGPYSQQVQYLVYALNGTYLSGLEQNTAKPFEPLQLNYDRLIEVQKYVQENLNDTQKQRLTNLLELISGFESALSLEVLASVDFICRDKSLDIQQIKEELYQWSDRKHKLFTEYHIEVASQHLATYKQLLNIS